MSAPMSLLNAVMSKLAKEREGCTLAKITTDFRSDSRYSKYSKNDVVKQVKRGHAYGLIKERNRKFVLSLSPEEFEVYQNFMKEGRSRRRRNRSPRKKRKRPSRKGKKRRSRRRTKDNYLVSNDDDFYYVTSAIPKRQKKAEEDSYPDLNIVEKSKGDNISVDCNQLNDQEYQNLNLDDQNRPEQDNHYQEYNHL